MKLKKKTIYVYQYNGYNGAYARSRQLLWRCTLIGANGAKMFGGDWQSEGSGHPDRKYADRDAAKWADFLGWKVIDLGRQEQFDEAPKG